MSFKTKKMSENDVLELFKIEENYFNDFKAKDISGKGLSKIISAFCNASGGDVYIGIREENTTKKKYWEGYKCIEDANAHIQIIDSLKGVEGNYDIEFLQHPTKNTYVLHVMVFKSSGIVYTTDKKIYIRKGAQSLPVDTDEKKRRLELDKGISSYEDETIRRSTINDAIDSAIFKNFVTKIVPQVVPEDWLTKQRLYVNNMLTIAGLLLFSDEPQICLPKRSSIKVFRYKTSGEADRDTLDGQPLTIEGCAYNQIYNSVAKVKEIIENIKKLGKGFETIEYPEETLHEIITNAVLHRDYSIATDIQIRIFDNRVEVESPGKLPGHVTVKNILGSQTARNPKIVRLINKFPDAPNKDVGEGLNTAFAAMEKLRLKSPIITELENSVLVEIRHEKLASPEEIVIGYMKTHESIRNREARSITGIKSENIMKRVFYSLRDQRYLVLLEKKKVWVRGEMFEELTSGS